LQPRKKDEAVKIPLAGFDQFKMAIVASFLYIAAAFDGPVHRRMIVSEGERRWGALRA
jgi:hypothetical protein